MYGIYILYVYVCMYVCMYVWYVCMFFFLNFIVAYVFIIPVFFLKNQGIERKIGNDGAELHGPDSEPIRRAGCRTEEAGTCGTGQCESAVREQSADHSHHRGEG